MSLVARYKLNDEATLTTDSVGSFDLINVNNVGTVIDATYGTAANFVQTGVQGDETYLHTTVAPAAIGGNSVRTYSSWVRLTGTGTRVICGQGEVGSASGPEHQIMVQNDVVRVLFAGTLTGTMTILNDTWYNIVVTYDGTTVRLYIDGVFALSRIVNYDTHSTGFAIGHHLRYVNTGFAGFGFDGQILDFRIYDDALSAGDITNLFNDGPNPVTIVDWVLDANNKYEVSSRNHLIQIMNGGTVFENTGTVPLFFLSSNYIQTADIDLEGDSTHIAPIGISTAAYFGEYDGNGFSISNWSYVDPDFATDNPVRDVGLFGFIQSATVKNVTLDGVCTMTGFRERCGMVVGNASNSNIFNIDCNLSSGSFLTQSTTMANPGFINAAAVIGNVVNCTVTSVTFRGVLDHLTLTPNSTQSIVAGVIGRVQTCTINLVRNLGIFSTGLSATVLVGGVLGEATGTISKLINGMTGDLTCASTAGGVAGLYFAEPTAGEFINSMTGNITSTGSGFVGGVIGQFLPSTGSTMSSLMNYMEGNIITTDIANRAGGIIGNASNDDVDLLTSINAMNGDVYNTVLGRDYAVTDLAFVDTSFGLTFTVNDFNTTTPITGLPTDPGNGLPIVDLTANDPDGVVHVFQFIFANVPPVPVLDCNRNLRNPSGTLFPSSTGSGPGLIINGSYTTDENGIVLSGDDNTLRTSTDITYQTVGLWFRFNGSAPSTSFNLFDSRPENDSFSILTPGPADRARSELLGIVSRASGWVTSLTTTMRYSPENDFFMWTRNRGNIVRFNLSAPNTTGSNAGNFINTQVLIQLASASRDLRDFDYRYIDDSFYGFEFGNGNAVAKFVGGVQSYITTPFTPGHLQGIRYRKSDDKFIFVLSVSNKVYMMDPITEEFTELNNTISDPVALAIGDGDTIYYQTSGRIIMSLDLSSLSNTPVQVSTTPTGNSRNIDYHNGKVYVTSGTSFVEVDVATGVHYTISGIVIEKTYQAIDPVNNRVLSVKQIGETIEEHGYNFQGIDGPGYVQTTGSNPILNTYINGEVSDIANLQSQPADELINLVFTLTDPVTGPLTLFGDASNTGSPDVTVDTVSIYDHLISDPAFLYDRYLAIVHPLTITPRPQSLSIVVVAEQGATGYRITTQREGSGREVIALRSFTDPQQTIRNLVPATEYTVRLYSSTGTGFRFEAETIVSTLENSAANYDVNEFLGPSGRFDISTLGNTSVGLISDVMNDLFTTDDAIDINISGRTRISRFVNRGDTVDITNSEAVVAPFSTGGGPGQAISMTLSDATSVAVTYDETTEELTIGPTTYNTGESLVLDGQKVTIVDI